MHGGLSRAGKEKLSNGQNLKEIYEKKEKEKLYVVEESAIST